MSEPGSDDAPGAGPVQQPELQAVDVDGVRTVLVGTILFAVAGVLTVVFHDVLRERGQQWWTWTCLAGFGLGLLGYEYCRSRRAAIARLRASETRPPSPTTPPPC